MITEQMAQGLMQEIKGAYRRAMELGDEEAVSVIQGQIKIMEVVLSEYNN